MVQIGRQSAISGELVVQSAGSDDPRDAQSGAYTVLVVEDDPTTRLAIGCMISGVHCRVVLTSAAEEALERMWSIDPDVIVSDFILGGMTGREFCATLRASPRWRYVPIIVVTSIDAESVVADILRSGADDVMQKPVRAEELRARVSAGARRRRNYVQLGCEAAERDALTLRPQLDISA